jgi:hypothetical protein
MSATVPVRGSGRPSGGYKLADGTRVPSVTTITGHLKSAALIGWAYKRGRDGFTLYGSRDEAAEAGSIAHQWIEDTLHGAALTEFPDNEIRAQAQTGFEAFLEWNEQFSPRIVETEVPLISEEYRFGGTIDAVAIVRDTPALFDWKTSGGTYPDYIAQVAAYRQLLRERDGDAAPERAYLLRVGKEHADFHFHSWPASVLDLGWQWFRAMHDLYVADKRLAKVAA